MNPLDIVKFDVTGKLEITLKDESVMIIPLKDIDDCVRPGCHICTDLTALHSDVSAGSVGTPNGSTTLIIRNTVGEQFVNSAVENGELLIGDEVDMVPIEKLSAKKLKRMQEE